MDAIKNWEAKNIFIATPRVLIKGVFYKFCLFFTTRKFLKGNRDRKVRVLNGI